MKKGDLAQPFKKALTENASLTFWGATALTIKMVAAKRGLKLKEHGSLWAFVNVLSKKSGDKDIIRLFNTANALHRNFYENETIVSRKTPYIMSHHDVSWDKKWRQI